MGHSDIKITAQVYSHLLDGDLRIRDQFLFTGHEDQLNKTLQSLMAVIRISGSEDLNEEIRKILTQLTQS